MEGAKLKERFDQIFESTRFAKALEDLRKLRREKMAALKDSEHALALAEASLGILKGVKRKVRAEEAALEALHAEQAEARARLASATAACAALKAASASLAEQRTACEAARLRAASCKRTLEDAERECESLSVSAVESALLFFSLSLSLSLSLQQVSLLPLSHSLTYFPPPPPALSPTPAPPPFHPSTALRARRKRQPCASAWRRGRAPSSPAPSTRTPGARRWSGSWRLRRRAPRGAWSA